MLIATEKLLPIDTPFLKTSVVGSDPLNIMHKINKVLTPDDGSVMFCPHVKVTKPENIIGRDDGGTRFGSPIKG